MKLVAAKIHPKTRRVTLTFRATGGRELTRDLGPRGLVSIHEAARIAGMTRMRLYRMIGRGELKRTRQGRVTMLAVGEVLKLVA